MSKKADMIFFVIMTISLIAGGIAANVMGTGNFHTLTEGEAYRSAQLDKAQLDHYVRKYGIKSIICLRGKHYDSKWFTDEIEVSNQNGVKHYSIAISAMEEPADEKVIKILEFFKYAPRPVLIHCKHGADRTGLASAIWKVVVDCETKDEAAKQLSIKFGHFPIHRTVAMDRYFEKWNPASMGFANCLPR